MVGTESVEGRVEVSTTAVVKGLWGLVIQCQRLGFCFKIDSKVGERRFEQAGDGM